MGSKKNVDMSQTESEIKVVAAPEDKTTEAEAKVEATDGEKTEDKAIPAKVAKKNKRQRGKKYQAVRSQVDKTKLYEPKEAIELVKKLSYSKFGGSVEAHLVVREIGMSTNIALPHSTGKSVKVAIVTDALLADIKDGQIDFDVLVASPEFMPKLARFARVLGPKGLMPNPKNGTLTPNPELKKKELEAGKFMLKTEKKAPLMHLSFGKVNMETKDLLENLMEIIKSLKGKLVKMSIAASMSPGVKVNCEIIEE